MFIYRIRRRSWIALIAIVLVLLAATPQRSVARAPASLPVERGTQPVVITGAFVGQPNNQVFVYRWTGSAWEQLPFQIDEISSANQPVSTDDGQIDADDQIVFLAQDLGVAAPDSPVDSLPIDDTAWYSVRVVDPLDNSEGWAYIVRSDTLSKTNATDYVVYQAADQLLLARDYTVGWATTHSGLETTTLFGSADILDRTKVRVALPALGGGTLTVTEDDLPAEPLELIKDGPVRVIVSRGTATTYAYAAYTETVTFLDVSALPPRVTIQGIRLSTDLNVAATGATFYNENVPNGVTVDGVPDTVPATPVTQLWRQVSLDSGSFIQTIALDTSIGTLAHYYDDSTAVISDTGDLVRYGDAGLLVTNPTVRSLTVVTAQFVVPGRQPNRGAEFYGYVNNPLTPALQAVLAAPERVYLPLVRVP